MIKSQTCTVTVLADNEENDLCSLELKIGTNKTARPASKHEICVLMLASCYTFHVFESEQIWKVNY